jgi:pheromone shutdown protein TraB
MMEDRDKFIARTINETLQDGETAILFIGAYHNVRPQLSKDILVKEVKEQEKVKAYLMSFFEARIRTRLRSLPNILFLRWTPLDNLT